MPNINTKYKEGNNRPPPVKQISFMTKPEINDTLKITRTLAKTQVCE